jgi:hypothetical protein
MQKHVINNSKIIEKYFEGTIKCSQLFEHITLANEKLKDEL